MCRSYARKHGRALIFDTVQSGLFCRFDECFVPKPGFGPEVLPWSADVLAGLNAIEDVVPPQARSVVDSFVVNKVSVKDKPTVECVFEGTEELSHFDFEAEYAARLLVYARFGGGVRSIVFLSHVALVPDLANRVARRLLELPGSFDAIHIRATDMVADLAPLDLLKGRVLKGRNLVIASDSAEVKSGISEEFARIAKVISVVEPHDNNNRPLHLGLRRADNFLEDALIDLFALARSERFFMSLTDRGGVSGYAMLAELLRVYPGIFRGLFEFADASLVRRLFPERSGLGGYLARSNIRRRQAVAERAYWQPQPKLTKMLAERRTRAAFALGQDRAADQRLLAESAPRD